MKNASHQFSKLEGSPITSDIACGTFLKLGRIVKSWKCRRFSISSNAILTYMHHQSGEQKGSISVASIKLSSNTVGVSDNKADVRPKKSAFGISRRFSTKSYTELSESDSVVTIPTDARICVSVYSLKDDRKLDLMFLTPADLDYFLSALKQVAVDENIQVNQTDTITLIPVFNLINRQEFLAEAHLSITHKFRLLAMQGRFASLAESMKGFIANQLTKSTNLETGSKCHLAVFLSFCEDINRAAERSHIFDKVLIALRMEGIIQNVQVSFYDQQSALKSAVLQDASAEAANHYISVTSKRQSLLEFVQQRSEGIFFVAIEAMRSKDIGRADKLYVLNSFIEKFKFEQRCKHLSEAAADLARELYSLDLNHRPPRYSLKRSSESTTELSEGGTHMRRDPYGVSMEPAELDSLLAAISQSSSEFDSRFVAGLAASPRRILR